MSYAKDPAAKTIREHLLAGVVRAESQSKPPESSELTERGAELRRKGAIGQCFQTGCENSADVDGWRDQHSEQFKKYGTHHPVGMTGSGPPSK